jgi:two-component system nitrate/nitrite response regulator NarL
MALVRVAVADDHCLMLDTVRALLEADGDFEVVAAVDSAALLLRAIALTPPDLVVLDVRMPGMDGLACLELIRKQHPGIKVVMLSGVDDPRIVQRALRLGAAAFVTKEVDPRDFAAVLRQALEETVASQPAGLREHDDGQQEVRRLLTPSELAVLEALARGLVNKQIALELGIAQQTVKFHLTNVYRKLGVSNRTEAIRYAFERGVVEGGLVAV